MELVPYFCGKDCGGDACPLLAELEGGRVCGMRRNPEAGEWISPCGKGLRAHLDHYSPYRLKRPRIRTGPRGSGQFREADWEEAASLVARKLSEIRAESGPGSTLCIASAGATGALHNTEVLARRFLNSLGGCLNVSGNYSSNAANYAITQMFGGSQGESGFDAATLEYSNLIVLWGSNPLEARLGAELPERLLAAKRRGAHILVIDPRRSRSARVLDAEWIGIQPGTDAALGYALLYEIMQDPRFDEGFVARFSEGFHELARYVAGDTDAVPKSASWASRICGIDAGVIRRMASLWWREKPVMLFPGYSIQRVAYGEEAMRLTVALQLATANSGVPGASAGSLNNRLPGPKIGKMSDVPALADAERLFTAKVPILRWADAILNPDDYGLTPIRLLYSAGGNFLNQGANVQKNVRALEAVDFAVCHELFMTPTARHCDVVLPVADAFEKEDIGIPWAGNYALYRPRILEPEAGIRSDYEIFSELAKRLGAETPFTEGKDEARWVAQFLDESEIEDVGAFKRSGVLIREGSPRSGLDAFFSDPHGNPLGTKSGKIEFSSPLWNAEMTRFWESLGGKTPAAAGTDTFKLLTPKVSEFVHSQRGARQEPTKNARIHIHPNDLTRIGALDGELLKIWNDNGAVLAAACSDEHMKRGVIWLAEGFWASPSDGVDPQGSANMLTSDEGTYESVSCIMHGVDVSIEQVHEASSDR
jgi:molybdopterin guanine dinucleotide-containing S/N-oxide reductase-like protein